MFFFCPPTKVIFAPFSHRLVTALIPLIKQIKAVLHTKNVANYVLQSKNTTIFKLQKFYNCTKADSSRSGQLGYRLIISTLSLFNEIFETIICTNDWLISGKKI